MSSKLLLVAASVLALAACDRNADNTATTDTTTVDNTITDDTGMMDNTMTDDTGMMDNTMTDDTGMMNDTTGMDNTMGTTPGAQTYTAVEGDTKASVAAKLGVPESQLQPGPGVDLDNLKPGDTITY
jgi:hypothetical protein